MDSNSRWAFSAGKFSLKNKQFFLLSQGLSFRTTKTKTPGLRFRTTKTKKTKTPGLRFRTTKTKTPGLSFRTTKTKTLY